jgi:dTDP-4-dehydrorhamnose 3,5-epimerase
MKVTETYLKDCYVIEPQVFGDERGSFLLEYNKKEFEEKTGFTGDFVLGNQSTSQYGVVRGLHLQRGECSQAKLVRVIKGKILDVVVDARKGSETFGKFFSIELSAKNNKQLFVPRGFLHGFSVLENDTIVSYKCDNYYQPDAEDGVLYNDKDLNIDWKIPSKDVILSEKDIELKTFKEFSEKSENGNKTVLTYGTFDLLHYGHIEILKRASKLGDKLVVGISTDEFNKIKGKDCKIPYEERKQFLESLEFVDDIIPETNWEQKIDDVLRVKADVFVMGDDWKGKFDFLKEYCQVIYLPRTIGISTTKLKQIL